jgi:uncharacterized membrane protein YcaP (DUF421 family)
MKKEEIHLGDIHRILFGQAPPEFMIEVLIRTVIIYIFLLVVVRLMGQRMSGQVTLTELAVMITLGAIVSPAMQLPDRGVLFGIAVLAFALAFQRGINYMGFKSRHAELAIQGKMATLVRDGIMNVEAMKKSRISRQQLYAMLREKNIYNLGKVKRAYLEACGILSVYTTDKTQAGLIIVPATDQDVKIIEQQVDDTLQACCNCGHVERRHNDEQQCSVCHAQEWTNAYLAA